MNSVHIPGYLETEDAVITAVCDIDENKVLKAAQRLGIPQDHCFNDYRELIDCDDVDVVDIATWNSMHCEIAKYAAGKGKAFSVEKPVGMNYAEALDLASTAEAWKLPTFVCLSWRYRGYTRYVKYLIDSGKVGKLYHIYVRCIKDSGLWEGRKLEWRFDEQRAGSGVLGDLGSHMIDIVRFWGEEFKEVYAKRGTYITERETEEIPGKICPVTTDDWCNILAELESGVSCTIELSRCATTIPDLMQFELYGEKGKLIFHHLSKEQYIEFVDAKTKTSEILPVPEEFNAVQSRSFIDLVNGKEDSYTAKIHHGLECQAVLDAALVSCNENRAVTIREIKEKAAK